MNHQIASIFLSHFNDSQLYATTTQGHVYVIKDFKTSSVPTKSTLRYKVANLNSSNDSEMFQQIAFSTCLRNIVYFVLDHRIVIFDTALHQSIGTIAIDSKKPPFKRVLVSKDHPNIIVALHDEGTLSLWRRKDKSSQSFALQSSIEVNKVVKRKRDIATNINNISISPTKDLMLVLLSDEGTLWKVEWEGSYEPLSEDKANGSLYISGQLESVSGQITCIATYCGSDIDEDPAKKNILAVGMADGRIIVIDMNTQNTLRVINANGPYPIRGIRWIDAMNVICFSTQSMDKGLYKNRILTVNTLTGHQTEIRKRNDPEMIMLRGLRVSPSRQYLILLFKEGQVQLWDLKAGILLKNLPNRSVCLEWTPTHDNQGQNSRSLKEQFALSTPNGTIHFFQVENGNITEPQVPLDARMGVNEITCIAWRGEWLACGSSSGTTQVFNLEKKKLLIFDQKVPVHKIIFSTSKMANQLLILHGDGEFTVWDIDFNSKSSVSNFYKNRDIKCIGLDWIGDTTPMIVTSEGFFRVVDRSLTQDTTYPISLSSLSYPLHVPLLLQPDQALFLKSMLLHSEPHEGNELTGMVDDDLLSSIMKAETLAERALLVSEYFGNTLETRFWLIANKAYASPEIRNRSVEEKLENAEDPASVEIVHSAKEEEEDIETVEIEEDDDNSSGIDLPSYFDLLLDPKQLKENHLQRAFLHEKKKHNDHNFVEKLVDLNLRLKENEKAIELLLDTPPDHPKYELDMLKACVISSMLSPEISKNTFKRVAAGLIASGNIHDGVQLLILAGRSLDACRYLQSFDKWEESALLAKLTLEYDEYKVVYTLWAEFLVTSGRFIDAMEIYLSFGEFSKVMYLLHQIKLYEVGALFIKATREQGFLTEFNETDEKIANSMFGEFSKIMARIGYTKAADLFDTSKPLTSTESTESLI